VDAREQPVLSALRHSAVAPIPPDMYNCAYVFHGARLAHVALLPHVALLLRCCYIQPRRMKFHGAANSVKQYKIVLLQC
jgi:hypothetical protein